MNVSLTPALEQFVRDLSESGAYNNASEVVRDALRLLMREERRYAAQLADLRAALAKGEADLESGDFIDLVSDDDIDAFFKSL